MRFIQTRMLIAHGFVFLGRLVAIGGSGLSRLGDWVLGPRAAVSVDLTVAPQHEDDQKPDWTKAFFAVSDADGCLYLVTPQYFQIETMSPASRTRH